eukprot:TRINITY_DN9847_c0_g2_i1.p1 TRINITY_DN9847_c0_g2~~TRINITY_DN9847_c0_g2_i1.p1  ORF type:complete len:519 (+),score=94.83 TRINITY_DN9847_c0_g2_i1:194-1750(+)
MELGRIWIFIFIYQSFCFNLQTSESKNNHVQIPMNVTGSLVNNADEYGENFGDFSNNLDQKEGKEDLHRQLIGYGTSPPTQPKRPPLIVVEVGTPIGGNVGNPIMVTEDDMMESLTYSLTSHFYNEFFELKSPPVLKIEEGLEVPATSGSEANWMWGMSRTGGVILVDTETKSLIGIYEPPITSYKGGRVAVDSKGNAWVTYGSSSNSFMFKIGLKTRNQCEDRNENGEINTSDGVTTMAWAGYTPSDECISNLILLDNFPRLYSISLVDDDWAIIGNSSIRTDIAAYGTHTVTKLVELKTEVVIPLFSGCGGKSSIIVDGILWSAGIGGVARYELGSPTSTQECFLTDDSTVIFEGITSDGNGDIYTVSPDSLTKLNDAGVVTTIGLFGDLEGVATEDYIDEISICDYGSSKWYLLRKSDFSTVKSVDVYRCRATEIDYDGTVWVGPQRTNAGLSYYVPSGGSLVETTMKYTFQDLTAVNYEYPTIEKVFDTESDETIWTGLSIDFSSVSEFEKFNF